MKFNKFLKLTLGVVFFAVPVGSFYGSKMLADHLSDNVEYEIYNENNLLACGGGGGNKPGALKAKKLNSQLGFKKRQLSKAAAAGEDTSSLEAEIKKLEAAISELD